MRAKILVVVGVLISRIASAQMIDTAAGGWPVGAQLPVPATNLPVTPSGSVATDAGGNSYIPDAQHHVLWKQTPSGLLSIAAGTGIAGYGGDNGPATAAQLWGPCAVAIDAAGNIYVADRDVSVIRRIDSSGMITTFAGQAMSRGSYGDGLPATSAYLSFPQGLAVDASGGIYIADSNNGRIRRVGSDGIINTIAGGTVWTGITVPEPALTVPVGQVRGLAADVDGNIYISSGSYNIVLRLAPDGSLQLVAGNGGTCGYSGDGGAAISASLCNPWGMAADGSGNVFIADVGNNVIRKVDGAGSITTFAGTGAYGYAGDGGPATAANLSSPLGIAFSVDDGSIYLADNGNCVIRKIDPSGTITTAAGSGSCDYTGDGGPATAAALNEPSGVATKHGNLYIADTGNNVIRMVGSDGTVSTVAGNGVQDYAGDGGPATLASLNGPSGIAVSGGGRIWIADSRNQRVREVDTDGTITTVAGVGLDDFGGDGGPATQAYLDGPSAVAFGYNGLYIADRNNLRIRNVDDSGIINTVAGTGTLSPSANVPTSFTPLRTPQGLALDATGTVYVADPGKFAVIAISPTGALTTVAGNSTWPGSYLGDGTPATSNSLYPTGVTLDLAGNLLLADPGQGRIFRISQAGLISTIAGTGPAGYGGDGADATLALLNDPVGVAVGPGGQVYISDAGNHRLRTVNPGNLIQTISGNGTSAYGGDSGGAKSAALSMPVGIAADAAGNFYIADQGNNRIRRVDALGQIATLAGNGAQGFGGDGGAASQAVLNNPSAVAADTSGNVYVADTLNGRIRKIDAGGQITTVAGGWPSPGMSVPALSAAIAGPSTLGTDAAGNLYFSDNYYNVLLKLDPSHHLSVVAGTGVAGFSGDGGPATTAQLNSPGAVAVDRSGNIYFDDSRGTRIRKIDAAGNITTVAGNGTTGIGGDGGPATATGLYFPGDLCFDLQGNLYFIDSTERIRKVDATSGILSTIAGGGTTYVPFTGFAAATQVALFSPRAITFDPSGNMFVTQGFATFSSQSSTVLKIDTSGNISLFAGNGSSAYSGDGGPATSASLNRPQGLATDAAGNVYIADVSNGRIRVVDANGMINTVAGNGVLDVSGFYALSGMGGAALSATLAPYAMAFGPDGTLFVSANGRVLSIDSSGIINSIAGNGYTFFGGDGGPGVFATLFNPTGVTLDTAGNLYIADANRVIRKLDTTGVITTIAGQPNVFVSSGDGGPAAAAALGNPKQLTIDGPNLYIIDGSTIRKVDASGTISTVAGTVIYPGAVGDGGPATAAQIGPQGVGADGKGNLYIADAYRNAVRKVDSSGIISTVAGNYFGLPGYSGDGGSPTDASLASPADVKIDASGNILIADSVNNRIRRINPAGNNTPPGQSVTVTPVDSASGKLVATIQLSSVSAPGETTVTSSVTVPDPPANFGAACSVPVALEITTTAILGGGAVVCISPGNFGASCPPNTALLHYSNGSWQPLPPAQPVGVAGGICGVTNSFSPFALLTPKQSQSITFGAAPGLTYGSSASVSATASSGLVVSFQSSTPATCTVSGTIVTGIGAGTCIIAADQAGDAHYTAAPEVTQSISVQKAAQSINFAAAQTISVGTTGSLLAVATSNLAVTYGTSTPSVCSVSGPVVTGLTAGTCTVTSDQAGSANYNPAPQVVESFTVSKAAQTITFGAAPAIVFGATGTLSATATSRLSVTFGSATPSVCVVAASAVTGVSPGTCTVTADQTGDSNYQAAPQLTQTFSVSKASQAITFGAAPALTVGGLGTLNASASSTLSVTFGSATPAVCAVSGSTVSGVAPGSCVVTADQTGSANYNPAPQATQNITVTGGVFLSPTSLTYPGQQRGTVSASQTITLSNGTAAAVARGTVSISSNFTIASNGCPSSIPAHSSCAIAVKFAPAASALGGPVSGSLKVGTIGSVSLAGSVLVPMASVAPGAYPFANQQVGVTANAASFVYTNTGQSAITVASVAITGGNSTNFAISSDLCSGQTLQPNGSCNVAVTFTPSAAGARSSTLRITDTAGGAAAVTASLSGTGVAPSASLTGPTPAPVTLPAQQVGTTGSTLNFLYTNTGIGPITVSAVSLAGSNPTSFVIGANGCAGVTLQASANCTIAVAFAPNAIGSRSASLRVSDTAGGAAIASIGLTGTGIAPAITLGGGTYSFGAVTAPRAATFTLSNNGTAPLLINSIGMATGSHFVVTGGTCALNTTLSNGAVCTVVVTFTPARTTTYSDTLKVSGAGIGAGAPTYSAALTMTGS